MITIMNGELARGRLLVNDLAFKFRILHFVWKPNRYQFLP